MAIDELLLDEELDDDALEEELEDEADDDELEEEGLDDELTDEPDPLEPDAADESEDPLPPQAVRIIARPTTVSRALMDVKIWLITPRRCQSEAS